MDADILRKQLRKSLVSTRRLESVGLDESVSDEEGSSPKLYSERQNIQSSVAAPSSSFSSSVSTTSSSNSSSSPNSSFKHEPSIPVLDQLDEQNEVLSDQEVDEQEFVPRTFHSDDSHLDYAEESQSEEDNDEGSEDIEKGFDEDEDEDEIGVAGGIGGEQEERGGELNHMSVLEAWSKQIEESASQLNGRSSMKVEYYESQARSPTTMQRLNSWTDEDQQQEFEPGANSREDLENLGKIFLRVKMEGCLWIEQVLDDRNMFKDPETGNKKDTSATETLFEALRDGVVLCKIANTLLPGCIPSYTSDFSNDASFMVPLSEKENIRKFIRACQDAMSIPDSLLFQPNDLCNNQNMPKVILSLRAVAEYARLYLGSEPKMHWPRMASLDRTISEDEDAILLASAEMSKMDISTVHHMYAVEKSQPTVGAKPAKDIEKAGFMERKRSIQQNLVMSNVGQKMKQREVNTRPKVKSQTPSSPPLSAGSQPSPSFPGALSHSNYDTSMFEPYSTRSEISDPAASVQEWLDSLGMGAYASAFAEDGWDDMSAVSLMTEGDLMEVGISKKGHRRKILMGLQRLKEQLALSKGDFGDDVASMSMYGSGKSFASRGSLLSPRSRRYSQEKREIMNKDLSWSQCRDRANVTLDLDDAKAIWSMFSELKQVTSKEHYFDNCSPDIARSVSHLFSLTEDLVGSLLPFDAPIILDIGWNSIKCGFAFSSRPIEIPTILGKLEPSARERSFRGSKFVLAGDEGDGTRRPSSPMVYAAGRNAVDKCRSALNASMLSSSSDIGTFAIRRTLHRGIDSIKDPVVIEWDDLERILQHIYRDVLHTFSEHHPVMIVEPAKGWGSAERQRLSQMLFETFSCPAVYFSPAAPLVAFRANVRNCVVLDLGESRSTASVVYNHRIVRDSVVNSPIAGLQLTELMMQALTQDGFEFKSIFEAKNPSKFSSLRHFMEQEIAEELKEQVCLVSDEFEEKCVNAESLPAFLVDYLPRVTRGTPYINIGEPRVRVPEALFSPEVIRRDQFYNGGSLHHIVRESIQHCTDVVGNAARETVILCGGLANLPGLSQRLQAELDELYSSDSHKPPRVLSTSDDAYLPDSDSTDEQMSSAMNKLGSVSSAMESPSPLINPAHMAWFGAAKVVMQHDFQSRWIHRQAFLDKGEKVFQESSVADGLGPFPLYSPDTALYKANRAVAALSDVVNMLHHFGKAHSSDGGGSIVDDNRSRNPAGQKYTQASGDHTSTGGPSAVASALHRGKDPSEDLGQEQRTTPNKQAGHRRTRSGSSEKVATRADTDPLSPRSVKDLIQDINAFLASRNCPEKLQMDVRMSLYKTFEQRPPPRKISVLETIQTLPDRLLSQLAKYIGDEPRRPPSPNSARSRESLGQELIKGSVVDGERVRTKLFSEGEESNESDIDNEDDDDEEEDGVWAMAI